MARLRYVVNYREQFQMFDSGLYLCVYGIKQKLDYYNCINL